MSSEPGVGHRHVRLHALCVHLRIFIPVTLAQRSINQESREFLDIVTLLSVKAAGRHP
jgi:hypothetical protein